MRNLERITVLRVGLISLAIGLFLMLGWSNFGQSNFSKETSTEQLSYRVSYLLDPSCSLSLNPEHKARIDAELEATSSLVVLQYMGCLITAYDIDVYKPGIYSLSANGYIRVMAVFTEGAFRSIPVFYENDTVVGDIDLTMGHHRIYAFGKTASPAAVHKYGVGSAAYLVWTNERYHYESFVVGAIRGVCLGILCIMALFFLFMNSQKNKVFLIYGLFILSNIVFIESMRSLTAEVFGYRAGRYYFETWTMVTHIAGSLVQLLIALYFASFYEIKTWKPSLYRAFQIFAALIFLEIPFILFQFKFGPYYTTTVMALGVPTLIVTALWFSLKRGGIYHLILIGYTVMFGCSAYFVLSTYGFIQVESLWGRDVHLIGSTIEVTLFSIATSLKLNQQFAQQLALNAQLYANMEEKVAERTLQLAEKSRDMRAILTNIKLGILTFKQNLLVDSEYSRYLESIFNTDKIADRHLLDLLFDGAQLNSDLRDQIRSALEFSIQQDPIGFNVNQGLLIQNLTRLNAQGQTQHLELDWEPIISIDNIVEKIIVTVRDVSEIRVMKEETEKNRRELDILNQLLKAGSERFCTFADSARNILGKSQNLITAMQIGQVEPINEAYRHLHTIKGNARVLGLLELSGLVHEAEHSFDRLRSVSSNFANDREESLCTLAKVSAGLDAYQSVYQDRLLHFSKDQQRVDNDFLLQIEAKLLDWQQGNPEICQELQVIIDSGEKRTLKSVLEPLMNNTSTLARELHKEVPLIHLQGGAIVLDRSLEVLLINVFGHLLSNALNHGIETSEQRLRSGKGGQGQIFIEAHERQQDLEFVVFDDGQGLNLAKIKSKAIGSGLIGAQELISDHDIARLIFRHGFSTANQLTQSAGRGVGMDAMSHLIESASGQLELFLDHDSPSEAKLFKLRFVVPKLRRSGTKK